MDRSSIRPWILALALAACGDGSDSTDGLGVQSISVPDFGLWECNRPIEFAFDQRIDFASVSARSIHIRTSTGVPAAGTFGAKTIDTNGDGVPERTDERVILFFPSCPLAEDLSDVGLTPGARYLVTLAGRDSGEDPASLLRSSSGEPLARTVVLAFEAISTLHDEKPGGAPATFLRAAGASVGPGCFLELGEDPSKRVFFEAGPVFGRTPVGFHAPLNLLGDPATHVTVVVAFDQAIRPAPSNLARLRLEYNPTPGDLGWRALETRTELLSNCRPGGAAVRLVPLGSFPPGGLVRAVIEAGFEDLAGEATPAPLDAFALTEVATVAFTSLEPAGAIADELLEEFDFGAGSPLSLADPARPPDAAPAAWGDGELRAADLIHLPPELSEFDWVVNTLENFVFDTTATPVAGGPDGQRTIVQQTKGGFVEVRNFIVEPFGFVRVHGPNPLVVHASGRVSIQGTIDASGSSSPDLVVVGSMPAQGGAGSAGGGAGGSGSAGVNTRGGGGSGPFGAGPGGGGGESGFAPSRQRFSQRGGGGGGGRFARDQDSLVAEDGADGSATGSGAESGMILARGGAAGPQVFTDGDPTNDFFGIEPVVDGSGAVVGRRRGELDAVHAGSGGGNGGDSIVAEAFPVPPGSAVREGGGGGGGGGAVVIRALGRIDFGSSGRILANGGSGGQASAGPGLFDGAAGGSGSGGHVILESAVEIHLGGLGLDRIQAVGGARVHVHLGEGSGGAGGPGVVQLHVPHPERALDDPASEVILPPETLALPDPLAAVCSPRPHILYLTPRPRSTGRSRWIPLGAAGEGGATSAESAVHFLFEGIETAPGEDHGKVRTSGGRVVELAPLLGPVPLVQPGVELLSDGISMALSGPVLAPLLASARPISPDVYLRTPALLVGHTLRFARVLDPDARLDLTVAGARYDDAASRLTLVLRGEPGTTDEAIAELGGAAAVELSLVPRFFRVRQGPSGVDLLPGSHSVRILFQGAKDDGTGHADELEPLLDWTADVSAFGALTPGVLDFVRFRVEFDVDALDAGFDPQAEPLALDFLRLPMRY